MRQAMRPGPSPGFGGYQGETGVGQAGGDQVGSGTAVALTSGRIGARADVCRGLRTGLT
jgi:hypothetical protein